MRDASFFTDKVPAPDKVVFVFWITVNCVKNGLVSEISLRRPPFCVSLRRNRIDSRKSQYLHTEELEHNSHCNVNPT